MSQLTFGQAMRLGAMALPEVHGPAFAYGDNGEPCGACAIGAAMFAAGIHANGYNRPDLFAAWPWANAPVISPTGRKSYDVPLAVVGLFEVDGWSRERIADWLDSIDPTLKAEPVEAPVAVTQI